MGAINVSPGSFYPGSVVTAADELLRTAERMVAEGAAIIDVGAMSTAPYGPPWRRARASSTMCTASWRTRALLLSWPATARG